MHVLRASQVELHEATKKLQSVTTTATQKPVEDISVQKKQIEEQRKQVEDLRKQVEDQKRSLDSRQRQIEQKEKELQEMEKQLKRRKEQVDQLEMSLQKVHRGKEALLRVMTVYSLFSGRRKQCCSGRAEQKARRSREEL